MVGSPFAFRIFTFNSSLSILNTVGIRPTISNVARPSGCPFLLSLCGVRSDSVCPPLLCQIIGASFLMAHGGRRFFCPIHLPTPRIFAAGFHVFSLFVAWFTIPPGLPSHTHPVSKASRKNLCSARLFFPLADLFFFFLFFVVGVVWLGVLLFFRLGAGLF